MKKILFPLFSSIIALASFSQESIYDFKVETITGEIFDFNEYREFKILIVNN